MNIHTHFIYAVARLSKNNTVHGNKLILIYFSETKNAQKL